MNAMTPEEEARARAGAEAVAATIVPDAVPKEHVEAALANPDVAPWTAYLRGGRKGSAPAEPREPEDPDLDTAERHFRASRERRRGKG